MEDLIWNQYEERPAILNTENIKICGVRVIEAMKKCTLFALSSTSICKKIEFLVSQGSVATRLRWGGYCYMDFVANFIRFPAAQIFWKSVKIWQSYRQLKGGNFLRHSVVGWLRTVMLYPAQSRRGCLLATKAVDTMQCNGIKEL